MQGTIDLSVWQQDLSVGYLKLSRSSDSYSAKTCEFLQCNDYTKEEDFLWLTLLGLPLSSWLGSRLPRRRWRWWWWWCASRLLALQWPRGAWSDERQSTSVSSDRYGVLRSCCLSVVRDISQLYEIRPNCKSEFPLQVPLTSLKSDFVSDPPDALYICRPQQTVWRDFEGRRLWFSLSLSLHPSPASRQFTPNSRWLT